MKKLLSFFLSFFLVLVSCSTSIDDSSYATNARGLSIAITTGTPARNLSRAADSACYKITVSVKGDSYKDSQTQTVNSSGKVDFKFEDVPVGISVTAECSINIGNIVIYKASDTAVIEPEGTTITLKLENVLESTFTIDSSVTPAQFEELMNHYNLDTEPTLVFDSSFTSFAVAKDYLAKTNHYCTVDFTNLAKTEMTGTDYDLYPLPSNLRTLRTPLITKYSVDPTNKGSFINMLNSITSPKTLATVSVRKDAYVEVVRAIAGNTNVTVANLTMPTITSAFEPYEVPAVNGVTPTNITKVTVPLAQAQLTLCTDAFSGWTTNVYITDSVEKIQEGALNLATGGTITFASPQYYWIVYVDDGSLLRVKAEDLATSYDAQNAYEKTTETD